MFAITRFRYIVYCIFSLKVTKNIVRYKVFVKPRFHCIGLSRKDDSFTSTQAPEYITTAFNFAKRVRSEFDTRESRYGKSNLLEKLYKSHTTTVYNTCFVVHTFEDMTTFT